MLSSKTISLLYTLGCACMAVSGMALPDAAPRGPFAAKDTHPALASGIPLRIMPLGASITHGVASSDGNGYRQDLRQRIVSGGNLVNMVGSNPNGTMKDNDNSGWPGFIIDQIHTKSNGDTPKYLPNLVLVNAGTNDAVLNVDIPGAGDRMSKMLSDVYAQSPQATIVLSTLIVNRNTTVQARGAQINAQYRTLVTQLQAAKKPIVLADMQAGPNAPAVSDLSADGTHPTDAGYAKMADIWMAAIRDANGKGFLRKATNNGVPDNGAA
ncbi:SGNH hydrolase-type esterase domain-containing protein [Xylariales sp. PMI_506]|nr:SGNH hydrolase-type esterase domain-containing protein [Xylariales sp. PMI_506]